MDGALIELRLMINLISVISLKLSASCNSYQTFT